MLVSSKRLMDFKVAGINELRKGDTILVDDQFICKITDLSLSAPGKQVLILFPLADPIIQIK